MKVFCAAENLTSPVDFTSVGGKEHHLGRLSKVGTWQSEEAEAAWRESGATVQNLKRGCVGLEFLTSAGFVALVDNENADDWMGRVSSLKTSMLELSSQETKICRDAQEVWIETTRRPFKSNDHDPWNWTRVKKCFDRLEQDPAWGNT